MARKNKPGAGRPFKKLDEKKLWELGIVQCTNEEIAACMGVSADTIERNYAGLLQNARKAGLSSLRSAQWKKAVVDGNPTMLIWCGKFFLGQKEEINFSGTQTDVKTLLERWEVTAKKKSYHVMKREREDREKQGIDVFEQLEGKAKDKTNAT